MTSKLWATANKGIQDPSEKKLDGPGGFGGFGVVFVGFLMLLPTFSHFPPTSLYFSLLLSRPWCPMAMRVIVSLHLVSTSIQTQSLNSLMPLMH